MSGDRSGGKRHKNASSGGPPGAQSGGVQSQPSGRKRGASTEVPSEPPPAPPNRPHRTGQGQGGRAEQLERAGNIAATTTRKPKQSFQGANDIPQNGLAPAAAKKPKKKKKSKAAPAATPQVLPHPPPPSASQVDSRLQSTFAPPPPPPAQGFHGGPLSRSTFSLPPGITPEYAAQMNLGSQKFTPQNTVAPGDTILQMGAGSMPGQRWVPLASEGNHSARNLGGVRNQPGEQFGAVPHTRPDFSSGNVQMPPVFGTEYGPNDPAYQRFESAQRARQRQDPQGIDDLESSSSEDDDDHRHRGLSLDIDEHSPDEDEQNAMAYLRSGIIDSESNDDRRSVQQPLRPDSNEQQRHSNPNASFSAPLQQAPSGSPSPTLYHGSSSQGRIFQSSEPVTSSESRDVLNDHHARNRTPKPPNPIHLEQIANSSLGSGRSGPGHTTSQNSRPSIHAHESDDSDSDSNSDSSNDSKLRLRRNSRHPPTADNAKPYHLRYYAAYPIWTKVLVRAKLAFQVYLLSTRGFPATNDAKKEGQECITEAISFRGQKGDQIEPEREMDKAMIKLVTDEASTFRGDVKKIVRAELPAYYSLFPDGKAINPDTGVRYTQPEREAYCAKEVKGLLIDGNFLNSGSAYNENMNHIALGMCLRKVIYDGKSSLASLFPATFKDSVPPKAVGLIATVMYNCLEEMATGRLHKISFSGEAYEGFYDEILESIEDLLKSDNGAEFKQQLKEWAGVKGKRSERTGGRRLGIKLNLLRPGH